MDTILNMSNASSVERTSFWAERPPEGSFYYKIEGFLNLFYLVHPKRTMYEKMEDAPNFYLLGVEYGPYLFIVEFFLILLRGLPVYKWNDSLAGFCALIMAGIPQAFIEVIVFSISHWIHTNFRLIDMHYDSYVTWFLCLLAADLSLYVAHRLTHEVNFLWAFHQVHHSSEYYNLFSPARNSFLDKFWISMCVVPWSFFLPATQLKAHHQINLIYQFWIHTRTIGMLGPLEYILATPTQHAIHHGRNRFCIDVNYGGFLSIWDQLFNTIVWPKSHTDKTIYYGLVSPVRSWDMVYLYGHYFRSIYKKMKEKVGLGNKLSAVLKGPGWEPGTPRLGNIEEIPEEPVDKSPYDKDSPLRIYLFCAVNLLFAYKFNVNTIYIYKSLPWYMTVAAVVFNTWTICDVCYMLEHKWFVPRLEFVRALYFFFVDWLMMSFVMPYGAVMTVFRYWFAFSAAVWAFNLNYWREDENKADDEKAKTRQTLPEVNGKVKVKNSKQKSNKKQR